MGFSIKRWFISYNGRHFTSRWARKLFEKSSIRKHFGYYLACGLLLVSLSEPAASAVLAIQQVDMPVPSQTEIDITTETTFSWPVRNPILTQGLHSGHRGIDIQDDISKNIYPIDEGWVSSVVEWHYGYGKHVIVQHPNGRSSLYAHFNQIYVTQGQSVTRDTVLGEMGRTGWASGVHLHLEIYQGTAIVDPLAVLPNSDTVAWRPYRSESDVFHSGEDSAVVTAET